VSASAAEASPARRIDKWLWCVRRFKTRALAARFVAAGGVRVTRAGTTRRVDKPSFPLREGDEVSYLMGERLIVLTVLGFAERRGSPDTARRLYAER
jgi:ribosome-associated heat shock protein Hsp15